LEIPVHLGDVDALHAHHVLIRVGYEDDLVRMYSRKELARCWNESPSGKASLGVGDSRVAQGSSVLLASPSVLVPDEQTLIADPRHTDFGRLRRDTPLALAIDQRLKRRK